MAENFGVEDRGKFYDPVGALRDVVQNHLLQVLALVAMEPPVGTSADDVNDKKAEVFRAIRRWIPSAACGVSTAATRISLGCKRIRRPRPSSRCAPRSTTGAGPGCRSFCVPARVARAGHRSAAVLQRVPRLAFLPEHRPAEANQIVLRIDPDARAAAAVVGPSR